MSENVHFSANQLKFIDWLAAGKYSRVPATERLFAEEIGVNPRTLHRWKNGQNGFTSQDFWDAVTKRSRELLKESLSDIYESLRGEAVKGSFQHQRLALELTGEYTETQRREISGPDGSTIQVDIAVDEALKKIYDNAD